MSKSPSAARRTEYLIGDEVAGEVATVEVGYRVPMILDRVKELGARIKYILATHRHRDHIGGASALKAESGSPNAAFKTIPKMDVPQDDGDELFVGNVQIEVLHTQGHTSDSVCFLFNGQKLLSGDTMYVGRAS